MYKKSVISAMLVCLLALGLARVSKVDEYSQDLRVHFIDVGHGDCIFIMTPNDTVKDNDRWDGHRILIDAGDEGTGTRYIIPYLESLGMSDGDTIDWVILTHAHEDHLGGMPEIYGKYQVMNTVDPGYYYNSEAYRTFRACAVAEPESDTWFDPLESELIDSLGDTIGLGNELEMQILHSKPAHSGNPNKTSIVLRLRYGDVSFLFMGDAEGKDREDDASAVKYVERTLVKTFGPALRSTVLKVGHHGSETSATDTFLSLVAPQYAVISAGRKHSLPDTTVIDRLVSADAKVWRTDSKDSKKSAGNAGGDDHILITTSGTLPPKVGKSPVKTR